MVNDAITKIAKYEKFGSRLGLERMKALLEKLGNPEKDLKVIHVAGTNGKGSVCRYIYETLLANEYKAGLYISPYIEVFNERMECGGKRISDEDLGKYTEVVLTAAESMVSEGLESPTEFEVVTAIAFCYFKEQACDFVVLEVGLGGSGDSTNVIEKPLISVITSISFDHMDRLGNTLAEIAGEKAGIIKPGVPIVVNVEEPDAAKVIARYAYEKNAPLYDANKIQYKNWYQDLSGQIFDLNIYGIDYSGLAITMLGIHQVKNAITAVTAMEILRKTGQIKVTKEKFYNGMKKAKQPARFEIVKENPYWILDGAHNKAGAEALAETMKELFPDHKILMVVGILADKEVDAMLEVFSKITDDFIAAQPVSERAMSSAELCLKLEERGKRTLQEADLSKACALAMSKSEEENFEVVLFGGSLYLVGKIREILRNDRNESS